MNIKNTSTEALKNIKHNYFKSVIVVFLFSFIISGGIKLSTKNILDIDLSEPRNIEKLKDYNKANSEIIDELLDKSIKEKEFERDLASKYTHGIFSIIINEVTATNSIIFSLLNAINKFLGGKVSIGVIIITGNVILVLLNTFVFAVLEIGKNRYFLENRRYLKTHIDRCLYPYKKRKTFKLAWILFVQKFYLFLWGFTIVGFFIKYYEYSMIPYVLAENPNIKMKDAFLLSKELTNGNKFNMFKLDLQVLLMQIIGLLTFNLINTFLTNIYRETLHSEIYMNLRSLKKEYLTNKELLNDELLDVEINDEEYPDTLRKKLSIFNIDLNKKYSLNNYILFFFTFSFIGWIWEVILHLVTYGNFVNRGTMYGPWLPIYGFGGIAILVLLKKFRDKPSYMFIASVLLCGIIEYSTAWYLETFKHLKYWDYTGYFLNIDGRICLEGLILFGLGGCAFTYILAPLLDNIYNRLNIKVKNIMCYILVTLYAIDLLYSSFIKPHSGDGITSDVVETV